jgi:2,3-bisphosphoglycerate-dependent phosphoglycerate mutase
MTDLIFIRHGQTDWNLQLRFQGQIDVPLNATGRAQAQRLADHLAEAPPPDAMVSSDLQRAQETAAPLAAAWAMTPALMSGLREQSFGVLEGLDAPAIQQQHPGLWARWLEHRADFALPGGESARQFHVRVLGAVRELAGVHSGRRVAVFTHGGVLDMLWRTAHGLPLDGLRECVIPNTGINRLRWHQGRLQIDAWGDDAHLAGLPDATARPALAPGNAAVP